MTKSLLNKLKSQKGFTLLELLVVIAIIAILAAVVIVNLNSARTSANDAKVQSAVQGLGQAFTLYAAQNNQADLDSNENARLVSDNPQEIQKLTSAGILPEIPVHPVTASEGYQFRSRIGDSGDLEFIIWGQLYSGGKNGDSCFIASNNVTKEGNCVSDTQF